ncbi:hypothetical protein BDQ17DRAFT_1350627 [Cyathus striatus]|nr:hypothetical protein BDQ17DRAFT_1350627 [Cyathus striatus]
MGNEELVKENNFVSIGKGLYLSKPRTDAVSAESQVTQEPTLILIFGWMGAKLPHIFKYTKAYEEIYPGAVKILVRSEAQFFWSGKKTRQAALAPVIETLEALGYIPMKKREITHGMPIEPFVPEVPPRILVHAFSNGGCAQLATLSNIISSRLPSSQNTSLPKTPSLLILDSAPGSGGIRASQRAFSTAIRNPILRQLVNIFIVLLYAYGSIMGLIFRKKSILDVMQAVILSPKVLPWFGQWTRRVYLYSTGDNMVPWQEVEKHAKAAEEAGYVVRKEKFGKSGHVAHAREDPARYWGAVKDSWEQACKDAVE